MPHANAARTDAFEDPQWSLQGGHGELIVRADARGTILFVSLECAMMGYAPEDLIERSSLDLVHPEDLSRFLENSASLYDPRASVDPDRRVHRFRRGDGGWVWLKGGPNVLPTHDGRKGDIVNVFRPVSQAAALAMLRRAN